MAISLDKAFGIHETALRMRGQRTEILAANMANADTPNYKARDLDFDAALKHASGGLEPINMTATHKGHIKGMSGGGVPAEYIKYRIPQQPSLDGHTVESHIEQAEFTKNAVEYQASLQFLDGKIKTLKKAITGGN